MDQKQRQTCEPLTSAASFSYGQFSTQQWETGREISIYPSALMLDSSPLTTTSKSVGICGMGEFEHQICPQKEPGPQIPPTARLALSSRVRSKREKSSLPEEVVPAGLATPSSPELEAPGVSDPLDAWIRTSQKEGAGCLHCLGHLPFHHMRGKVGSQSRRDSKQERVYWDRTK